jgi:hypothetical protein
MRCWQFIDSVSVVIDGTTVQTNQMHENVNATFKALTEMQYNDYIKSGPTSNFVVDSFKPPVRNVAQTLDNYATSSFVTATSSVGEFGLSSTFTNKGAADRSLFTSLDQQSGKLAFDIMGGTANLQSVSKPQVYVAPAGAVAAGASFYVAHYLATIKLRDICDYFKKCPMQKTLVGLFISIITPHLRLLLQTLLVEPLR